MNAMPRDIVSLYRAKLAKEKGTVRKDWGGRLSVALAYPSYYSVGMSNLGFQIVYRLLNNRSEVVAERVFLPEGQEMAIYLQSGKQLLSLESQTPINNFDLVAFSLSFENDYPNILKLLKLAKIPLLFDERVDPCPLIMAGGVTTFLNPEPLAPFIDFFLLGEAEGVLDAFLDQFLEIRHGGSQRAETIKALAKGIPSLYAPCLYRPEYNTDGTLKSFLPKEVGVREKVAVSWCKDFESEFESVALPNITTPDTEFGGKALIELGRGCGRSCRFCAAGYVYRPPRIRPESDICASIEKVMQTCDHMGLLAPDVSAVPGIENFTSMIVKKGGDFSVSSLRADTLSPGLLDDLWQAGQRTLAIAPEAGSERLRQVINKHLTRDQVMEAVRLISQTGPFNLRLYFLIGLPTETRGDVAEIVVLVKGIRHHMIKASAPRGTIGQIKLSVNCFVPKPFTPFQWAAQEQTESLKEKQKWLKRTLEKEGGIKVNFDVAKWAYVQALLAVGDRRVASILLKSHELNARWTKALRFSEVNPDFFVLRPKEIDEVLPWDFIDHSIFKQHLVAEYKLALEARESEVCRVGECYRCGVCV